MSTRRDDLTIVPLPSSPARFEAWPEDIRERARELWSTVGNGNASRVEWLLSRELPDNSAVPAAATIRRWAHDDDWESWSRGELVRTRGKTLRQLQTTWLRALQLSQEVQIDALLGKFDDNPAAGAVRLKAAETVQRIVAQSGLLSPLPEEQREADRIDYASLTTEEKAALARQIGQGRKGKQD